MANASSQESTAHTSSNRSGFSHWAGRPLVNYKEGFFEAQEECKAGMKVTHLGGKRLEEDKSFQDLFRSWLWQVPFLSLQVRTVAERHIEFVVRGQRSTDENFLPSHWLDFDSESYAVPLDLDALVKSLEPCSLEKAKSMAVSLKHLLQMIRAKVAYLCKAGRMEELRYLELDGRLGFNESTLQDQAALLKKKGVNALLARKTDPKAQNTSYVRERLETGSSYDDWAREADEKSSAALASKGLSQPIATHSSLNHEPSPDQWWKKVDLDGSDSDF